MTILLPILGFETEDREIYMKGLFEINRTTILQHVYNSLTSIRDAKFIAVVHCEDIRRYHLDYTLRLMIPGVTIVTAFGNTSGSACTCLLAVDHLDPEDSLVITGSNQLVMVPVIHAVDDFRRRNLDGGLITFNDIHPKWSYVALDEDGYVVEAAEKRTVSMHATTGFYYYKKASDFLEGAQSMIKKEAGIHGKYYVCPVYNEMILKQKKIGIYEISKWDYFNLGSEQGIREYEKCLTTRKGNTDENRTFNGYGEGMVCGEF